MTCRCYRLACWEAQSRLGYEQSLGANEVRRIDDSSVRAPGESRGRREAEGVGDNNDDEEEGLGL